MATIILDTNATGFDDFLLLSSAPKLIEDVSTYSFWAGIFSNASEKFVQVAYHGVLKEDPHFVYHDVKSNHFFGTIAPNGTVSYKYHIPPGQLVTNEMILHHRKHHNVGKHPNSHTTKGDGDKGGKF